MDNFMHFNHSLSSTFLDSPKIELRSWWLFQSWEFEKQWKRNLTYYVIYLNQIAAERINLLIQRWSNKIKLACTIFWQYFNIIERLKLTFDIFFVLLLWRPFQPSQFSYVKIKIYCTHERLRFCKEKKSYAAEYLNRSLWISQVPHVHLRRSEWLLDCEKY